MGLCHSIKKKNYITKGIYSTCQLCKRYTIDNTLYKPQYFVINSIEYKFTKCIKCGGLKRNWNIYIPRRKNKKREERETTKDILQHNN